jgi:hypothetical protein
MKLTLFLGVLVFLMLLWLLTHKEPTVVIVSSHWKEDLTWLKESAWPVHVVDHAGAPPCAIRPVATIPNKGREASSYLWYIVNNYENLPDYIAFIHGHEHAWHHFYKKSLLRLIRPADYLPLNGFWTDTSTHDDKISRHWGVIEPWVGPMPAEKGFLDGSAQFVVSRDRIRRHPLEAYKSWLTEIMSSDDDFEMGVMLEYAWHYIFGEPWRMNPFTLQETLRA